MKFTDVLRGHVSLSPEQIDSIWADAIFCLDTNVLLDIYRYTESNRMAFMSLLEGIKGRLFVPNRVAVEFARNRSSVIRNHSAPQQLLKSELNSITDKIEKTHAKHPHREKLTELIASMKKMVDDEYKVVEERHSSLLGKDDILENLLTIIDDKIGEPCSQSEIDKEYRRRKEGVIPPYCEKDDKEKDEEKRTGDVVIWLELLKELESKKKPLIFVTDDAKENWWQNESGRKSAQPKLVREMHEKSGNAILFYTSERFSELAPTRLNVTVPKELAEETKQIREQARAANIFGTQGATSLPFGAQGAMSRLFGAQEDTARLQQIKKYPIPTCSDDVSKLAEDLLDNYAIICNEFIHRNRNLHKIIEISYFSGVFKSDMTLDEIARVIEFLINLDLSNMK